MQFSKKGVTEVQNWQQRQDMLIGAEGSRKLANSRVAVAGLGGVGSAVVEALARAGIGHFLLIDSAFVSDTNRNRQLIATVDTIGRRKIDVTKERVLSINPDAEVEIAEAFLGGGEDGGITAFRPDYVVDAIDTISAKIFLIELCQSLAVPLLSSMGTGNHLSAAGFRIGMLSKTAGCPVARQLRHEMRERGFADVKVLYSTDTTDTKNVFEEAGRHAPGSISFVPPVAGFLIAGEVVRDLLAKSADEKKSTR